jgi:16S rRNA (cytosine967-C5)-methyltransferase
MPLRVDKRVAKAYYEALVLGHKIKPFQAAKRKVFLKYGILGTKYDRVFTAIAYRMQRMQGIVDRIITSYVDENILKRFPELWAVLRFLTTAIVFSKVNDEVFISTLVRNITRLLSSRRSDYGGIIERFYHKLREEPLKPLSIVEAEELRLLLPKLLIDKLRELLPESEIEEFAKAVNTEKPILGFRVNRLKATVKEVLEELQRYGVEAWPSRRVPFHIQYRGPLDYSKFKPLLEGKAVPQDEASAAAGEILGAQPGELIVDMCAAPGGKTTHLAELSGVAARIVAIDVFVDRIKRLVELAKRTGTIAAIHVLRSDATYASRIVRAKADRALLDPPCTSTGAIAKNPEARWRLTRESIIRHVGLQRRLLWEAVELLKPGGKLLYTVCSVLPDEGEYNIKWLLETRNDVELIPLEGPYDPSPLLEGTMRSWPHRHGTTGFFYALLEKKRG